MSVRSGRFSGMDYRDIRCLVVDDETFSLRAVTRVLGNLGCRQVDTAGDGEEALDRILTATNSYDIVVSDFEMPRMDGLKLLKTIRVGAPAVPRDIPFAMVTSHSEKHVVGAAFNLDVDCFVLKPITLGGLKSRLNRLLTTDRPVKEPLDYQRIEIAADALAERLQEAERMSPHVLAIPDAQVENAGRMVDLASVREGDELADDLYAPGGQLLVAKGHILSWRLIDRLRDLSEMGSGFKAIPLQPRREDHDIG